VLATYLSFRTDHLVTIPAHLSDVEAAILPCAGVTAWSAVKGVRGGDVVLVQGTGGVALMGMKFVVAMGGKVIVATGSKSKGERVRKLLGEESVVGVVDYTTPGWEGDVLALTGGVGVGMVLENGGTSSLVKSMRCTKREGLVSQVGYLGKQDVKELEGFLELLIDRKIMLRGVNVGSRQDFEEMNRFIEEKGMRFEDIIDRRFGFGEAEEAIEYVGKRGPFGKVVIEVDEK
jgi:NADPH:quinone reductase-like Zn-dependent oxidoreductase